MRKNKHRKTDDRQQGRSSQAGRLMPVMTGMMTGMLAAEAESPRERLNRDYVAGKTAGRDVKEKTALQ